MSFSYINKFRRSISFLEQNHFLPNCVSFKLVGSQKCVNDQVGTAEFSIKVFHIILTNIQPFERIC